MTAPSGDNSGSALEAQTPMTPEAEQAFAALREATLRVGALGGRDAVVSLLLGIASSFLRRVH